MYEPGCLDYPLLRGHTDNSGLTILYTSNLMGSGSAIAASNFLCTARDPAGGFYVMTEDDSGIVADRLFHVADDADGASGLREIPTQPTFADAGAHSGNSFVFHFCSMAAAKDGAVFIQSYSQLWKVEP